MVYITSEKRDEARRQYQAIHIWLRKHFPKKGVCERCGNDVGTERPTGTHYAFRFHPEPHTRNRQDYEELCPSCHSAVDNATRPENQNADPVANYRADGEWKAGVRPSNVIETVDDIEWALDPRYREAKQPKLVCRFCGDTRQVRTFDEASRWFKSHACEGEGVDINEWLAA